MKKRLLASVLAALMVVGMMPEAFAADPENGVTTNRDQAVAEVNGTYYISLDTAVEAVTDKEDTVTLLKNTTEGFATNKSVTIDLGGHTWNGIEVTNTKQEKETIAFQASAGNITIENGNIVGRVNVYDASNVTIDNNVSITNTSIDNYNGYGIVVWGDGTYGESGCKTPTLNMYGSVEVTGKSFAISTNGTDASKPVVNIFDGAKVSAADDNSAIYLPSGALTVEGGTITGGTAVYFKSTDMVLSGGNFNATGTKADYVFNGNGANITGNAIVVDNCNYPNGICNVQITGGNYSSRYNEAIGSYVGNGETEPITGFISGGTFTNDVTEYCTTGKTALKNSDGKFEVKDIPDKDETVEIDEGAAKKGESTVDTSKVDGNSEAAAAITIDAAEVVKDENGLTDEEENDAFKALKAAGKITVDENGKIVDDTTITVNKNTYLDATVNSCKIDEDKGVYEVSMDITPKYTLTATTDKGDSVKLANEPKEMKVTAKTKVEVTLPSVFAKKLVYINHDNKELYNANANENGKITFETNGFSPFTFTLTKPSGFDNGSSGGSSGGGSSSSSTYKVTVAAVSNGSAKVSSSTAAKDATVTVTLSPDKGYKLDKITVTDASGKEIATTKKNDTSYTFTMPAFAVTVKVTYVKDDAAAEEPTIGFNDVADKDWFADAVKYVADKGMMNGTSKTTFGPNDSTTRGMIVTVLYRLENEPSAAEASFTDVVSGQYYTNAVAWANANGIVTGYGNGKFGPNDKITREQLAAILYRYAQYKKYDVSVGEDTNILSYADAQSVSAYAIPAMQWACGAGIVNGSNGKLNPQNNATRAEVAAMLMRYCENVAK